MPANKTNDISLQEVDESSWTALANKKIYFGHQSVGSNIIDGMIKVIAQYPQIKLHIVGVQKPVALREPIFVHSFVGSNSNPASKTDDFAKIMDSGIGATADIALFKFCFVDFNDGVDTKAVFDHYKKTLEILKKKYPNTIFIHVTVPLTAVKAPGVMVRLKNIIKKIMGRSSRDQYADNVPRNKFNDLLRMEYKGKDPVFDLAAIESTLPSGARNGYEREGSFNYALVPEYTYDGGHLNEKGRKIVAEKLLIFLANLPGRK